MAGTNVITAGRNNALNLDYIEIDMTADATTGDFDPAITDPVNGILTQIEVELGTPAPDSKIVILVKTEGGQEITGDGFKYLDTGRIIQPVFGNTNAARGSMYIKKTLSVTPLNNKIGGANIVMRFMFAYPGN